MQTAWRRGQNEAKERGLAISQDVAERIDDVIWEALLLCRGPRQVEVVAANLRLMAGGVKELRTIGDVANRMAQIGTPPRYVERHLLSVLNHLNSGATTPVAEERGIPLADDLYDYLEDDEI